MEKILDALKVILEKHLIPTILSLVIAAFVFLVTPNNNWIVDKISEAGFYLLCAGITFLIVQLIIYLYKTLSEKLYYAKERKKRQDRNNQKAMEGLWSYVDELDDRDREILYDFLNSDNKAMEIKDVWYSPNSLLSNEFIVHSRKIYRNDTLVIQYILDETFFNNLKYSYTKYGRICHFFDKEKSDF